jgi:hypothetical protein
MNLSTFLPISLLVITAIMIARNPPKEPILDSHVITAEEQANLTPDEVLQQFKEGN